MIHLLFGENQFLINQELTARKALFDGEAETYDGTELVRDQLPGLFSGMTLFGEQRLIIIRGLSGQKTLWNELPIWLERASDTTEIYLVEYAIDKRTKTYKWLQQHAITKSHQLLDESQAKAWVKAVLQDRQLVMSDNDIAYLVGRVGTDQWRLAGDINKLVLGGGEVTRQMVDHLIEPHAEASAFELIDALLAQKTAEAGQLLAIVRRSEDPYRFMGLLVHQWYALALLLSAGDRSDQEIAGASGLHPFVVKKSRYISRRLSAAVVRDMTDRLLRADHDMKTTGVDPWRILETVLLEPQQTA